MKNTSLDEVIQSPVAAQEALRRAIHRESHSALPGIVHSFDSATQTASIRLAIRDKLGDQYMELPLLTDVPVFFPGGAKSGITYPVSQGDECLVVFSDSCIDAWFQSGGVQNPAVPRKHDLSDGFAFVGFRSKRNSLTDFDVNEPRYFGQTLGVNDNIIETLADHEYRLCLLELGVDQNDILAL